MQVNNENEESHKPKRKTFDAANKRYQTIGSVPLFEESIRVRLEQLAFNAHSVLDYYQSQPHDHDALSDRLRLTQIELGYLVNELKWLEWIKRMIK